MKRLRWQIPERKVPKRPYRDTALFYGILAGLVVVIAWVTGGDVGRAAIAAAAAFLIGTGFSWWRWRVRLSRQEDRA
jgi:Flp pilus assembly protein TadB